MLSEAKIFDPAARTEITCGETYCKVEVDQDQLGRVAQNVEVLPDSIPWDHDMLWAPAPEDTHRLVIFVSLLALSTLSTPASAADDKIYPGLMCVGVDGSVDTSNGLAYNTSSSAELTVRCPIVRDVTTASAFTATAYLVDATPSDSVDCTFYYRKSSTIAGSSSSTSTSSSGYSSTPTSLSWSLTAYSGGYNDIKCTLPVTYGCLASGVVSYLNQE